MDGADLGGRADIPIPERDQRTGQWDVRAPSRVEVDTPIGTFGRDIEHDGSDHPSGEENQRLRQRVQRLSDAVTHLRQAEGAAVVEAVVAALRAADVAMAGPAASDAVHELETVTHAWQGMAGGSGSAESYQRARDRLVPALEGVLRWIEAVRDEATSRQRRAGLLRDARPAIDHLELEADLARGMVGTAMSQAGMNELAAAISNLAGTTTGADVITASVLLFTALGDVLYGDSERDPTLVAERGEWARLHDFSGVPARFVAARDQLVAAANEVHTALGPWVGTPPSLADGQGFGAVLIHASVQARGGLSHLTDNAIQELTHTVAGLAAATDRPALAAAVMTVLEQADRLFHDHDGTLDHEVTTEMAAWVATGTASSTTSSTVDTQRDQVHAAATTFIESVRPHLYHLVDDATRTQLLQPLVHAATTARHQLDQAH